MCCRISCTPLDAEIAVTILAAGLFLPSSSDLKTAISWERRIPEEHAAVVAHLQPSENRLDLSITPAISIPDHHIGKRVTAGVYFEIAAKYCEKVNGTMAQLSPVGGCQVSGNQPIVLAAYPERPLLWQNVCAGFQAVILGGEQ